MGAGVADRLWAHQIQLTIADAVSEAHHTHQPVGTGLYYEDQQQEASRATKRALKQTPLVLALDDRVTRHRCVSAHLLSERRIPFNEDGIFRHYPELDV